MNFNAIIAVLVLRGVITEDEGTRIVEYLNDKPQSTVLRDSVAQIAEIIGKLPNTAILPQLGPVGPAQHAEELAARLVAVPPTVDPTTDTTVEHNPENDEPAKTTSVKKSTDKAHKK